MLNNNNNNKIFVHLIENESNDTNRAVKQRILSVRASLNLKKQEEMKHLETLCYSQLTEI